MGRMFSPQNPQFHANDRVRVRTDDTFECWRVGRVVSVDASLPNPPYTIQYENGDIEAVREDRIVLVDRQVASSPPEGKAKGQR